MKIIFLLIGLAVHPTSDAQKIIDVNTANTNGLNPNTFYTVSNAPFVNVKYVKVVEGTPYLADTWMKGVIIGKNGQRYLQSIVRFDLLANDLYYISKEGTELISTIPAKQIKLEDSARGLSYLFIHSSFIAGISQSQTGWYQLLDSGKISLYKFYKKSVSESLPYSASTYEQHILTQEQYYIESNNDFVQLKKIKDILNCISDRKKEVETFLKQQDQNGVTRDDLFRQVVKFYNSIL